MKKHFFFDMDKTIAPSRQPILDEMYNLLTNVPIDVVIVSGQTVPLIAWQSNNLPAYRLGQNGNHAVDPEGVELWHTPLEQHHRDQILDHINEVIETLIMNSIMSGIPLKTVVLKLPLAQSVTLHRLM